MSVELAIGIIIVGLILGIDQGIKNGDMIAEVVTHLFCSLGITHFINLLEKLL